MKFRCDVPHEWSASLNVRFSLKPSDLVIMPCTLCSEWLTMQQ